jgi:D-glycero-alpha-D-manno-heptose-7-phosphate kinase
MLIRAKAPLRIGFAGGGTDVPPFPQREGGCVLSATVNRYSYGTLRPKDDNQISIESVDFGLSLNYAVRDEMIYDGKLDLVKAAIRRLQGGKERGFELFLRSDAPPGSGLGSSSSLMVTLVGLLKEFQGIPMTDYEIAELAYVIERKDVGIEGGMQDQYAATFGGCNFIEFLGDQVIVNPLRLSPDVVNELEHNLLLCFTGRTHVSGHIIEDQTARYERGEAANLEGLRRQKSLASEMKNMLLQHKLHEFGQALHEAWEFKKKISPQISNPQIDALYQAARNSGAIGGKLSGAGGGGFMLFYCAFERKHEVAETLKKMGCAISDFSFDFHGMQTWRVSEVLSRS